MTAQRDFLEKLVKAHGQWDEGREYLSREIPSYDPIDWDQDCADEDMGDYDLVTEECAYRARDIFINFAAEARKILKEA